MQHKTVDAQELSMDIWCLSLGLCYGHYEENIFCYKIDHGEQGSIVCKVHIKHCRTDWLRSQPPGGRDLCQNHILEQ